MQNLLENTFFKNWWRDAELNCGHMDFQSTALPTELSRQPVIKTGGADGIWTRDLMRDRHVS